MGIWQRVKRLRDFSRRQLRKSPSPATDRLSLAQKAIPVPSYQIALSSSAAPKNRPGRCEINMRCRFALAFLFSFGSAVSSETTRGKRVEIANRVTYQGIYKDGVESFLGIKYGQDTSGENRFEPPKPFEPTADSKIEATSSGPACPQDAGVGESFLPLYLTIFRDYSEDCLSLNVNRPNGTIKNDGLPVMVFIHGTFFTTRTNQYLLTCIKAVATSLAPKTS